MSTSDSKATARRFDQRKKRQADRVRLRGTRGRARPAAAPSAAPPAPPVGVRPATRVALADRLRGTRRAQAPSRPVRVQPAAATRVRSEAPEAPPNVIDTFVAGFDRLDATLREGLKLTSRSELDHLKAENGTLQQTVADQQAVIAAKDEELNSLRAHLATGEDE